jgi:hypothetical protein
MCNKGREWATINKEHPSKNAKGDVKEQETRQQEQEQGSKDKEHARRKHDKVSLNKNRTGRKELAIKIK